MRRRYILGALVGCVCGAAGTVILKGQCFIGIFALPGLMLANWMNTDWRVELAVAFVTNIIICAGVGVYMAKRTVQLGIPVGLCRNCGYNLTGNVSGVCPEYGKPNDGQTK